MSLHCYRTTEQTYEMSLCNSSWFARILSQEEEEVSSNEFILSIRAVNRSQKEDEPKANWEGGSTCGTWAQAPACILLRSVRSIVFVNKPKILEYVIWNQKCFSGSYNLTSIISGYAGHDPQGGMLRSFSVCFSKQFSSLLQKQNKKKWVRKAIGVCWLFWKLVLEWRERKQKSSKDDK